MHVYISIPCAVNNAPSAAMFQRGLARARKKGKKEKKKGKNVENQRVEGTGGTCAIENTTGRGSLWGRERKRYRRLVGVFGFRIARARWKGCQDFTVNWDLIKALSFHRNCMDYVTPSWALSRVPSVFRLLFLSMQKPAEPGTSRLGYLNSIQFNSRRWYGRVNWISYWNASLDKLQSCLLYVFFCFFIFFYYIYFFRFVIWRSMAWNLYDCSAATESNS